jgi:2-amino-4-hydroxy-6-hydroxymethyldihydropteridine diphosphokinase
LRLDQAIGRVLLLGLRIERAHEGAFVLVPLADVAPDWVHPVFGETVRAMRDALSQDARDEVVPL